MSGPVPPAPHRGIRLRISFDGKPLFLNDSIMMHLVALMNAGQMDEYAEILRTVDGLVIEAAAVMLVDNSDIDPESDD